MQKRLCQMETMQLFIRPQVYLLALIVLVFAVVGTRGMGGDNGYVLFYNAGTALNLLPLGICFAVGDILARDRQSGYAALILARGVSKGRFLQAKTIAAWCLSLLLNGLVAGGLLLHCSRLPFAPLPLTTHTYMFFVNEIIGQYPVLLVLFVALIYSLATFAMLGIGMLLATYAKRAFLARVLPSMLILALGFLLPPSLAFLNPAERLMFLATVAPWNTPFSTLVYWSLFAGISFGLTFARYRRQDDC